jgi:two-component system, sensor histidine kinase
MSIQNPIFLYVEDDYRSRIVLQVLIERVMGYRLILFEDSEDFEAKISKLEPKPNIIFLDIQIGPIDGYAMLSILRKHPDYQNVTIIAMTANVMSHDVEKLKAAGFTGLIGKPVVKEIFEQLMEGIFAGEAIWYVP